MTIDKETLPKDLKEQEEKDAMVEGAVKGIMGFIGLFTAPWLGVAVAGAGALTYAASFFVGGEKRLEYQSNGIKAMLGGLTLSFPLTSFLVMIEGGVTAISGRRDGPFAPFANISRFIAEGITGYPQTEVEMLVMRRQYQQQQQSEKKAQLPTQNVERQSTQSVEVENEKSKKAVAPTQLTQTQSSTQRKAPTEQQPPAQGVEIREIQKAKTYAAAQTEYSNSLKSSKARKFVPVGKPTKTLDGVTTIVFGHPDDPSDTTRQVTYQIQNGKPISITPGEAATCKLPPIPKETSDGFEVISIHRGEQTVLHETTGARTSIVQAKQAVGNLAGRMEDVDSSTKSPTSTVGNPQNKKVAQK